MNESEVRAALDWGWTSYTRKPWARDDGRKLYTFYLRSDTSTLAFQTCTIQFWAKRRMVVMAGAPVIVLYKHSTRSEKVKPGFDQLTVVPS